MIIDFNYRITKKILSLLLILFNVCLVVLQIVSVDEMQVHPDPSDYSDFGVELEIRKASADGTQVSRGGLFWFWCLHSTLRFEKRLHLVCKPAGICLDFGSRQYVK